MIIEEIVTQCRASQNKFELTFLLKEVKKVNPKVIVEIGSWRGWLLDTFREAFPRADVIGIEKDGDNVDPDNQNQIIIGDSQSTLCWDILVDVLDGRKIDFLFIDGDHMYDTVKNDFLLYSQLVRKGGIIALHDVYIQNNPTVEVYKFWEEIKKKHKWNEIVGRSESGTALDITGTGTGILYL